METFFLLMFGHYLADYPLQGAFLAKEKSHLNGKDPDHPDVVPLAPWYQTLLAHAWIHGGFIFLVTHSLTLAMLEIAAHGAIDYSKCAKKLTYNQDQALHFVCKAVWALLLYYFPGI